MNLSKISLTLSAIFVALSPLSINASETKAISSPSNTSPLTDLISSLPQRDVRSLGGEWLFWLPENEQTAALPSTYKSPTTVSVPHTYNLEDGLEEYAGTVVYSRPLPIDSSLKGKRLRLCFDGVYHDAKVYINDNLVGENLGAGYTPFSFDITPYLNFDCENILVVETDNSYSDNNFPWQRKFDWSNDGGIYRSVKMVVSGPQTIRYVHVTPSINLADSTAVANFEIRLWNDEAVGSRKKAAAPKKLPRVLDVDLSVVENTTGRFLHQGRHSLKRNDNGTFSVDIDCGKVQLCNFDDPNLYTFIATVYDNGDVSDTLTDQFGFRTFTIEGNRFVLNGEAVRMPGLEEMPGSNPEYGMAEPKEYMKKSIQMMKDLNCTLSRFHWVQDDYRLHLMDSLGIMTQEELSWWQGPNAKLTPEQMETAKRNLDAMVEAHYNHPSIWGWGISNEVRDNKADLPELYDFVKSLDSTRIVDVVCNHIWEYGENDPSLMLDLPTWNEYVGTWHAKHRDQLPGFFEVVEKAIGDRPVLIAENGLCEPAFTGGDTRRIDEMLYHIGEWKRHDNVCGYIYFCLQDYRTQMGEEGYGRNRIRRHGIATKTLEPKPSYYVLQQLMCPIEIISVKPSNAVKDEDTLANLYDLDTNMENAEITIRVKNDIPSYTLRGYVLDYADANGNIREIPMPKMNPGEEYSFVLEGVNDSYNFVVKRKDGSVVIRY